MKPLPADGSSRNWIVDFEPGTITAVGRNGGEIVATAELRTSGKPAKVHLTTNCKQLHNAWDDVAIVEAEIVDEHGIRVPRATNLVKFRVSGAGQVVAVDSGSIISHEPFDATQRQRLRRAVHRHRSRRRSSRHDHHRGRVGRASRRRAANRNGTEVADARVARP